MYKRQGLDSSTILMPDYKGKTISGRVITARKVDKFTGNKTWEWGWYVCVELDAGQTPDAVNYLYFCHNARNLVSVGQRVKSGDALAVMGNTGNAALASPPFAHCHFEVRATTTGAGLDPTEYTGHPNAVGTYGTAINGMEDDGMKFLKVTSGKCEVFTCLLYTSPANTFTTDDIEWQVEVTANTGAAGTSEWIHVNTQDALSTPVCVSPVGAIVEDTQGVTFVWRHEISTGTAQTAYELQTSSNMGGPVSYTHLQAQRPSGRGRAVHHGRWVRRRPKPRKHQLRPQDPGHSPKGNRHHR